MGAGIILLIALTGVGCRKREEENIPEMMELVGDYQGYTRTIGGEEFEFYQYFVEREASERTGEEELRGQVMEYANKVNAIFFFGNKLELCEPYSFELLKLRMQQENDRRQLRLEKGEPVYGLEQFDLSSYFQYTIENLENSIISYLTDAAGEETVREAKDYFKEHSSERKIRTEVVYELLAGEKKETVTADREQLNFMGKADKGLADFLETAEIGACFEDDQDGDLRKVTVKEIHYEEADLEKQPEAAVENYIYEVVYPQLIEKIAQENPLEYQENGD